MGQLLPVPKARFLDSNGDSLSGGKVYTYIAGTSTNKATYTAQDEVTPNANPVVLDSNGEADIWLGSGGYKIVLKTSADVTQWTVDDVYQTDAITTLWSKTPSELQMCVYEDVSGSYKATNAQTEWSTDWKIGDSGQLVTLSTAADARLLLLAGSDADEEATIKVEVGNAASGDALTWYGITGAGNSKWFTGMDNSDSDKFKIAYGSESADYFTAANVAIEIDTSKDVTFINDISLKDDKFIFLGDSQDAMILFDTNDEALRLLAVSSNDIMLQTFNTTGLIELLPNSTTVAVFGDTAITFTIKNGVEDAFVIKEGSNEYLNIDTSDETEVMYFGNATDDPDFTFLGTGTAAFAGDITVADDKKIIFGDGSDITMEWVSSTGEFLIEGNGGGSQEIRIHASESITLETSSGNIIIGSNSTVLFDASTASFPPLRIPHGTAPTSPTNGDMWTTTAGLYVRINGGTVGPLS